MPDKGPWADFRVEVNQLESMAQTTIWEGGVFVVMNFPPNNFLKNS